MSARRNFGTMPSEWQDRRAKGCPGFKLTFEDGFVHEHHGGMITLPNDLIEAHGTIVKSKELT